MDKDKLIQESITYLNKNKKLFFSQYTKDIIKDEQKIAIFTAGMSGVGKTEFAIFLKENERNLLHIDTDEIRKFFIPLGYDGQNSSLFQKASSRGYNELFNYAIKNDLSIICDSNFANVDIQIQNIERLIKKGYNIEIFYLYNYPHLCFEYATRREIVTKRKVPKSIFIKSNINSYNTIIKTKEQFNKNIVLNFFDKRYKKTYKDIDSNLLKELIGEDFEI